MNGRKRAGVGLLGLGLLQLLAIPGYYSTKFALLSLGVGLAMVVLGTLLAFPERATRGYGRLVGRTRLD